MLNLFLDWIYDNFRVACRYSQWEILSQWEKVFTHWEKFSLWEKNPLNRHKKTSHE